MLLACMVERVFLTISGDQAERYPRQRLLAVLSLPNNQLHANLHSHPDIFVMELANALAPNDFTLCQRLCRTVVGRILLRRQMSP